MSDLAVFSLEDEAWILDHLRHAYLNNSPQEEFFGIMQHSFPQKMPEVIAIVQRELPKLQSALARTEQSTTIPESLGSETYSHQERVEPPRSYRDRSHDTGTSQRTPAIGFPRDRNLSDRELMQKGDEILCLTRQLKADCVPVGASHSTRFAEIRIKPDISKGVRVSKVMDLRSDLIVQCELPTFTLLDEQPGYIAIQIPKVEWEEISLVEFLLRQSVRTDPTQRLQVLVGFDRNQCPLLVPLDAMLVAGTRGSGKTTALKSMGAFLCRTNHPSVFNTVWIDLKRAGFDCFNGSPWNWMGLNAIHEAEDALSVLDLLIEEGERRQALFSRSNDLWDYNRRNPKSPLPEITLFVDELDKWRKNTPPEKLEGKAVTGSRRVDRKLALVAETLRSAGISLIISTQHPNNQTLASEVDANLPQRIGFLTSGTNESAIVFNDKKSTEAAFLLGDGDGIYRFGGQPKQRFQAALITDDQIETQIVNWGISRYDRGRR